MKIEFMGGMLSRSVSMPTSLRSEGMAPAKSIVIDHWTTNMHKSRPNQSSALLLLISSSLIAPLWAKPPAPDLANYRYGPHERNVLDLWKAESDSPTPLLAFFHGGGFDRGDKSDVSDELITSMLEDGISIMSVNYRLTPQAKYPEHYLDCALAIQTARLNSKVWNIDPQRVAATGISAGGVISLWLAFHDDLADPASDDPVLRESSRLRCAVVINTPTSLSPNDIEQWISKTALKHRFFRGAFFGLTPDEARSPEAEKLFLKASPLTYLTADDPPVFAFHHGPKTVPLDISVDDAIHHYNSGVKLKQRMDELGLECELFNISDVKTGDNRIPAFLEKHFGKRER
jgi:acetyl esterase/lipase